MWQTTGWFFWLVPPRKVLSMELVPPNRKKWLSTLVPPKTQKEHFFFQHSRPNHLLKYAIYCSNTTHLHTFLNHGIITNFLCTLPCRWSPPPQILHSSLAPKLLHKPVQGSSWGRWRGVGYTPCGRRPPDDENETRERERTWRLPVTLFSPDLCQVSPLHLLFHQKCALGHGPFPYHGEALKLKVRSLTILINDP